MTLERKTITAGAAPEDNGELRDMTRRFWIGAVHEGRVPIYFESAPVIVVLVLLGQVLELRARPPVTKELAMMNQNGGWMYG